MTATVIDFNDAMPSRPQADRYDLDLIVQRLRETAEYWVPRLFPNGKRVGDEWRLANIRGDAPRNTGSCVITLRGPHAGDWDRPSMVMKAAGQSVPLRQQRGSPGVN